MEVKAERWYKAIFQRKSRRTYLPDKIPNEDFKKLKTFIQDINSIKNGFRIEIIEKVKPSMFRGIIGSYGRIKNPPAAAVFIGNEKVPHVNEKVGYFGESFILESTALGLATCWIGGDFNDCAVKKEVELRKNDKIFALTPLGYAEEKYSLKEKLLSTIASSRKRKNLDELCIKGYKKEMPPWVDTGLKCARLAPSAYNRQPWRFKVDENCVAVFLDTPDSPKKISKRLDCGIVMLHMELGALYEGVVGNWEYLKSPGVAVFRI